MRSRPDILGALVATVSSRSGAIVRCFVQRAAATGGRPFRQVVGILAAAVVVVGTCAHDAAAQTAVPSAVPEMSAQEALDRAGKAYEVGDYARAAALVRKAADLGVAAAQFNLGLMYDKGQGVTRDYAQAMVWYRKAADQGLAPAQYNVGALYASGQGGRRDDVQAMSWVRRAAEQGYAPAQRSIGAMYESGQGVAQDYVQALIWFHKVADREIPATDLDAVSAKAVAGFHIGTMYEAGHGVPKDEVQAAIWYQKAAALGDADAKAKLAQLQQPSSVKAETLNFVCRNARVTTLISIDSVLRIVRVQGTPSMEFKEGKQYYVTVTDDLIEFGCRKTMTDVDIATGIIRNGAVQWFGNKKAAVAPIDLACMSKNRIDRHTGIWTASRSTVAGPQTDVSECSLTTKRELDAGGGQTTGATIPALSSRFDPPRAATASAPFVGYTFPDYNADQHGTGSTVEAIGQASIPNLQEDGSTRQQIFCVIRMNGRINIIGIGIVGVGVNRPDFCKL